MRRHGWCYDIETDGTHISNMNNIIFNKKALERDIETYYERARQAREKLDLLEKLPEEPPVDSVIYFQKQFGNSVGKTYTFVAVSVWVEQDSGIESCRWFISGMHTKSKTWDELVQYIISQEHKMPKIWIATEWSDDLA